jgi:hypothetical protein
LATSSTPGEDAYPITAAVVEQIKAYWATTFKIAT